MRRRLPTPVRRPGAVALALAVLAVAVAVGRAGAAAPPALRFGAPFTLASGFQAGYGAGAAALGADGTVWLAQAGYGSAPASGFEILARAPAGGIAIAVATSDGAGSATDRPAIAAYPGGATFVWETASSFGGPAGTTEVRARSCTLRGCGPVQVVERWRWSTHGPLGGSGFTAVGDAQPGLALAAGRVVTVLYRDGPGAQRMEWASAPANGRGRFGAPRALGGAGGPVAVLSAQRGGGILAAWTAGDLAAYGSAIEWARWSARGGFDRPRVLAGSAAATGHLDAGLAAAPAGAGTVLAWVAGANVSDPAPAEPVWVAHAGARGGFGRPRRVFGGLAAGLSAAGAGGTLALAWHAVAGRGQSSDSPGPAWAASGAAERGLGTPARLAARADGTPAVAVVDGTVVAAWNACRAGAASAAACTLSLAVARGGGAFTAAPALGGEDPDDAPALHAAGGRVLAVWEAAGVVRGALAG